MKQVWIPRIGAAKVLEVREAPDPAPGPGEVRVAVEAAGVNFADVVARQGLYLDAPPVPFVPGYEVAGRVDALGPGVEGPPVGARVLALTRFGGYSSKVCIPAAQAVEVPEALSPTAAAAIPVVYLTAWHSLVTLGNLRAGERVLLHAAAGGVGLAALQICKLRGAGRVFGTASASKHEALRAMGLTDPIDYRSADFEAEVRRLTDGQGVHVVLDAVGGRSFKKSYALLTHGGRLICFGASSITGGGRRNILRVLLGLLSMPRFKPIDMMMSNRGVFGVNMLHMAEHAPDLIAAQLKELVDLVAAGRLAPTVDLVVPYAEAPRAHLRLEERGNVGKVVLDFSGA
ncbi:MAG: zinc-binding dehydrogenase [Planctomycetes bacterium]|nr:zinc-binding dehydrogenase [Planctomycetota bacterium]